MYISDAIEAPTPTEDQIVAYLDKHWTRDEVWHGTISWLPIDPTKKAHRTEKDDMVTETLRSYTTRHIASVERRDEADVYNDIMGTSYQKWKEAQTERAYVIDALNGMIVQIETTINPSPNTPTWAIYTQLRNLRSDLGAEPTPRDGDPDYTSEESLRSLSRQKLIAIHRECTGITGETYEDVDYDELVDEILWYYTSDEAEEYEEKE